MLGTDRRDIDIDEISGLGYTPPLPDDLPLVELSENAHTVLMKRYLRRGEDGDPIETVEEMFWRVAYHVAVVESEWENDVVTSDFPICCKRASTSPTNRSMSAAETGRFSQAMRIPCRSFSRSNSSRVPSCFVISGAERIERS